MLTYTRQDLGQIGKLGIESILRREIENIVCLLSFGPCFSNICMNIQREKEGRMCKEEGT